MLLLTVVVAIVVGAVDDSASRIFVLSAACHEIVNHPKAVLAAAAPPFAKGCLLLCIYPMPT